MSDPEIEHISHAELMWWCPVCKMMNEPHEWNDEGKEKCIYCDALVKVWYPK